MTEVYAAAYDTYWSLGWQGVLPLPPREKSDPPKGFTGRSGAYPSYADLHAWAQDRPADSNLCLRMPDEVIGIDVDNYGTKNGAQTIADYENHWGTLPYSPRSTSRQEDGDTVSGIRFYRVPPGVEFVDRLPGVEIIQRHHRYAVCWPSIHPEGRMYRWYGIDGGALDEPPAVDDIPELPAAWLEGLRAHHNGAELGDQPADPSIVDEAITEGEMSRRVESKLGHALTELHSGECRHDAMRDRVLGLLRLGKQGEPGVKSALTMLQKAFGDVAAATGRPGGREGALYEFREFIYKKVDGRWIPSDAVAQLLAQPDYDDWVPGEPPDADDDHAGEWDGRESQESADKEHEPTTWEPMDLGPYLRGEVQPPKQTVGLARSDGIRFLYDGRENVVIGETESGKTWFALGCVARELRMCHHVLYIHYEEADATSTIERLRLLGVPDTDIATGLRFVAPNRPPHAEWLCGLLNPIPTLVIHDGINEAMTLLGAEIKDVDGASEFRRRLIRPCTKAGATTLGCDHMPMMRDSGRRDAYGSVHKGNALDGARILLENIEPFGRNMRGASSVYVTKDRPGRLRTHGTPTKTPGKTFMGVLVVDDMTGGPDFLLELYAPREDEDNATGQTTTLAELGDIVHQVIAALPDHTVDSLRKLYAAMRQAEQPFREQSIRMAVDDLVVAGRLAEVPGKRGATGYRAVLTAARESST